MRISVYINTGYTTVHISPFFFKKNYYVSRAVRPTVGFFVGSFMDKPKCLILAHKNRAGDPGDHAV